MGDPERAHLFRGRGRKAADIMVTVALRMRDAVKRQQRRVLLDRKTGLTGEIFSGEESARAARSATSVPRVRR